MLRRLWDIARKKDSMWVNWCHVFMLRRKKYFGQECLLGTSLGHRGNLMKLRQMAYSIGHGRDTWMWLENWHLCGPLLQQFGTRVVYDAGTSITARLVDFIKGSDQVSGVSLFLDLLICSLYVGIYLLTDWNYKCD